MQIQINTGHNIQGSEALVTQFTSDLQTGLARFSDTITRLEAHLSDETAQKGGQDNKRCTLEARLEGLQPLTVTNHASTVQKALKGAERKLVHLLESTLGRLHDEDRQRAPDAPTSSGGVISS